MIWSALAAALTVTGPSMLQRKVTVKVWLALTASVLALQVTVLPDSAQPLLADCKLAPAGICKSTLTLPAISGPVLLTVST